MSYWSDMQLCWSHPSLYHISKKGWCIFLMPRGFAYWLYKLLGGLKTGQPVASMPKPERGQVLTGWLNARRSSQSILKEANARCSCSWLWVPLNYEQNQELLLCMQITWSAPLWFLDRNHPSACVGIPHLLIPGGQKVHCSCTSSFHASWCASGLKEKRPVWLGGLA